MLADLLEEVTAADAYSKMQHLQTKLEILKTEVRERLQQTCPLPYLTTMSQEIEKALRSIELLISQMQWSGEELPG